MGSDAHDVHTVCLTHEGLRGRNCVRVGRFDGFDGRSNGRVGNKLVEWLYDQRFEDALIDSTAHWGFELGVVVTLVDGVEYESNEDELDKSVE